MTAKVSEDQIRKFNNQMSVFTWFHYVQLVTTPRGQKKLGIFVGESPWTDKEIRFVTLSKVRVFKGIKTTVLRMSMS